jgi:hypothetical protein
MPYLLWSEWRSGRLRFLECQLFPRHFVDHRLGSGADASLVNTGQYGGNVRLVPYPGRIDFTVNWRLRWAFRYVGAIQHTTPTDIYSQAVFPISLSRSEPLASNYRE